MFKALTINLPLALLVLGMSRKFGIRQDTPRLEDEKQILLDSIDGNAGYDSVRNPPYQRKTRITLVVLFGVIMTASLLLCVCYTGGNEPRNAAVLFKPTNYEVVTGFFAQSLRSTNDGTFDFVIPALF